MTGINQTGSIITLNVNSLNIPTKGQIIRGDGKTKIQLYIAYRKFTLNIKTQIKGIEKYQANTNENKTGVFIFISDKADFGIREGIGYKMIKGSILKEDITILNVYTPNNRVSKYVMPKLIEL